MMIRTLTLAVLLGLLSACGDDQAASSSAPAATSAAAPAAPAPAAEAPAAEPMADDEEEIQYDPIDVSKLENQWWQQYSTGS